MARTIATNTAVDLEALLDFVRPRHHLVLVTTRSDGRPQISPVTGGADPHGRIVVSTYPERAKTTNARRDPQVSVLELSDDFGDTWVHMDGECQVIDVPDSVHGLVENDRCISGEHPDPERIGRRGSTRAHRCASTRHARGRWRLAASRRATRRANP